MIFSNLFDTSFQFSVNRLLYNVPVNLIFFRFGNLLRRSNGVKFFRVFIFVYKVIIVESNT